ncbi:hypothetical protein [Nocardiopsis valliformis]|uniref:hypothetical protein n=1 Tax=Nocardiopsis valliformis TaxID=239974 RepID=UPI0003485DAA|nr:hypothetical protein [Nocardiopsis valliformis]
MTSERLPHASVGPLIGLLTAAAALAFAEVTAVLTGAGAGTASGCDRLGGRVRGMCESGAAQPAAST